MTSVKLTKATPEDLAILDTFDFTKLSAIATCPVWGIIRYGHHKTTRGGGRAMPLEAGEAMHQVFAAVRLIDLSVFGTQGYGFTSEQSAVMDGLIRARAEQQFGEERAEEMWRLVYGTNEDERTRFVQAGLYILETSGFYDDPNDKRRTLDKLGECVIAYVDRHEWGKHLPYIDLASGYIGCEQSFAIRVDDGDTPFVYTGRIDGTHSYRNDPSDIFIEENKTASRLNDAWEMSFDTSHQVTGYVVASSVLLGRTVRRARIRGVSVPQPKAYENGISNVQVMREDHHIQRWFQWAQHIVRLHNQYYNDPLNAPQYTHSCNRYFRPCSFIPLCASPEEEKQAILDEMVVEEWSPLHEKSTD